MNSWVFSLASLMISGVMLMRRSKLRLSLSPTMFMLIDFSWILKATMGFWESSKNLWSSCWTSLNFQSSILISWITACPSITKLIASKFNYGRTLVASLVKATPRSLAEGALVNGRTMSYCIDCMKSKSIVRLLIWVCSCSKHCLNWKFWLDCANTTC